MKNFFKGFLFFFILYFIYINSKNSNNHSQYAKLDRPESAAFRDYIMMGDPQTKTIPFDRFPKALKQTHQKIFNVKNQNLGWASIQSDMGGRVKTICVDPNIGNGNKVWAGAATGGLWYNNNITDIQSEWHPVSDVWPTLSISSIVFDPNNPQIMYVGTGEYETAIIDIYRESSGRGYGIWKSTDGGNTFTRLMSTSDFAYISDLAIKNENGSSVVYAGVVSGRYRGAVFQAQPTEGLYRSTDGGQTWQQVLPAIPGTNEIYAPSDIEISTAGRIFVGSKRNFNENGGGTILYSDTGLPGSWTINDTYKTQIEASSDYNIPGRVKIASAPSNPNKIYAVFAAKSLNQTIEDFPQTIGKYIVTSNNAGLSWHTRTIPDGGNKNWAYLAWHALSITVDPNDENTVYAGGLDLYKTADGGATWQELSDWTGIYFGGSDEYVHADIHHLEFINQYSSDLLISTDGGIFYSQNIDQISPVFENRNYHLSTLQFYSCAIKQLGNEQILGGLQDNGSLLYTGSDLTENDMVMGGDGAFCAFDTNEDGLLITTTYDNSFLVWNTNSGDYDYISDYPSGLFTSTFDYDSVNNTIWAIASDLHGNRNNELLRLDNLLQNNNYTGSFINIGSNANSFFSAIRLIDENTLLVGTADGKLYRSTNIRNTITTTEIDGNNFPAGFISCIQTAQNGQKILVIISNYGVQSVWLSNDGGQTWQNKEGNLPDMPIRWGIFHPQNDNQVMLATETGIWTTDDISSINVNWLPESGLPNVRVDMLDIRTDNNKVVAATHGRGLFTATWNVNTSVENNLEYATQIKIYPNPATTMFSIEANDILKKKSRIYLYDLKGKKIKDFIYLPGKKYNIKDIKKGTYILKHKEFTRKLIIK